MIMESVIWFSLTLLSLIAPPFGGLGLLLGYTLADKAFALINIASLIRFPLFITEPVLAILLVRAFFHSLRNNSFDQWQIHWKSPWAWFYVVGFVNILFGLLSASPVLVLRDAVIVFYAVVTQITLAYVRTLRNVKIVFFVLLGGLLLRFLLQYIAPVFGCGSPTYGMYAACAVLGCLCTFPLWGRWKPAALLSAMFLTGVIAATEIRTIWAALFLAVLFLFIIFAIIKEPGKTYGRIAGTLLAGIFASALFLRVFIPIQYTVIKNEFRSLFAGKSSPNVMTRFAMWADAIQQVAPFSEKVFDVFDRKVLNPFYFKSEKRPDVDEMKKLAERVRQKQEDYTGTNRTATDIIRNYEEPAAKPVKQAAEIKAPARYSPAAVLPPVPVTAKESVFVKLTHHRFMRLLFGIPFGQRFVPERISAMHQINRYDPHNSLIAIFYRAGLIGFVLFAWLVCGSFYAAFKALKRAATVEQRNMLLAVMASVVYHVGHSLTDVTLENPFKGIPFWLLLGLMIAITSIIKRDNQNT